MSVRETYVIIGAGTAGAFAARALRNEGFDGKILLIGAEKEYPYARPPLTKQYLQKKYDRNRLFLWPRQAYDEMEIEVLLDSRVIRIVPSQRQVELENGRAFRADKILIATGMSPRKLPLSVGHSNVHYLRTLADSESILGSINPGANAALIGGGFIGMEVAASLAQQDVHVIVVHREAVALEHAIGADAGKFLMNIHKRQGVAFYSQANVSSIEGGVRANCVKLESGETIECDVVVIGAGVIPALDLIEGTGIRVNREIIVDEYCQTNIDNVFAAGDVTEFFHPILGRHLHIEHWDNARLHGIAAAQNMLGRRIPFIPIPFFWSDQYLDIQYTGFPLKWEKAVVRGNVEDEDFSVFLLGGTRLVAAVCFGRWKERRSCERILREGGEVDPEKLADEEFNLDSMTAQPQRL